MAESEPSVAEKSNSGKALWKEKTRESPQIVQSPRLSRTVFFFYERIKEN